MNLYDTPLQYHISSWSQLPQCLSNTSKYLHIRVGEFLNSDIKATRITVEHDQFGILFAYLVDASGSLLCPGDDGMIKELSPEKILKELAKFGFLVTYDPVSNLKEAQIDFLKTLDKLNYDKIRTLSVWEVVNGVKQFTKYIVAFLSGPNPYWLNSNYCPSKQEYNKAIQSGTAFNVSALSEAKQLRWTWLDGFVANIEDVIRDYDNYTQTKEGAVKDE